MTTETLFAQIREMAEDNAKQEEIAPNDRARAALAYQVGALKWHLEQKDKEIVKLKDQLFRLKQDTVSKVALADCLTEFSDCPYEKVRAWLIEEKVIGPNDIAEH